MFRWRWAKLGSVLLTLIMIGGSSFAVRADEFCTHFFNPFEPDGQRDICYSRPSLPESMPMVPVIPPPIFPVFPPTTPTGIPFGTIIPTSGGITAIISTPTGCIAVSISTGNNFQQAICP